MAAWVEVDWVVEGLEEVGWEEAGLGVEATVVVGLEVVVREEAG